MIFRATRNPAAVSLLAVIEAGPYLLLGIAAGYLADRINRQRLIVAGFVGAAVVAVVQATGLLSGTHLALIYGCALLAATIFVITDAAEFGLLPRVINTGQLPRAWGLSSALADGCAVAVPPLATTVVAITGAAPVLACDALSFLVASALIARLRPRAEPTATMTPPRTCSGARPTSPMTGGQGRGSSGATRRCVPWLSPACSTALASEQ